MITGKKLSFGFFDTFEEDQHQVELCKSFGWDLLLKPFVCMKYILKLVHDSGKTVWRII